MISAYFVPGQPGLVYLTGRADAGVSVRLLTNALDSRFSKEASVVIHVPRGGEKGKIPLHGTVLLCLEMIILSVASTEPQRTIKSMKRINEFHRGLNPGKKRA